MPKLDFHAAIRGTEQGGFLSDSDFSRQLLIRLDELADEQQPDLFGIGSDQAVDAMGLKLSEHQPPSIQPKFPPASTDILRITIPRTRRRWYQRVISRFSRHTR